MLARRVSSTQSTASAAVAEDVGPNVLGFLSRQQLPATPQNYALGFLIVTNSEGLAARAVDAVLMNGDRLTSDDVGRILAAHGPKEEEKGESEDHAKVRRHTLRLAELAATAVEETGEFGRALEAEQTLLAGTVAIAELVATMIERSTRTETQLAKAAKQIEDLRQEVETAKGDAHNDSLTGLHNRRGVLARLQGMTPDQRPLLAICDIDRFKTVNDRYGHVVGDRVLKLVAASIKESCGQNFLARWGGEEFLVIFNGAVTPDEAFTILNRAREDLANRKVKLRATDQPLGLLSFSAGIARFGEKSLDQAIAAADALLYQAKENGRNQVLVED
ncbi:GGDEF domain-containing protein [Sphingomonas sp. BIUV-7]|uniref:diguanylate cyclase n=1 Tax=Sphingomonas natans TaxID=3063330 RepID=A0ABT8YFP6_9SPHN|nr:GGDEF domain-containing protein [Sphingomonas sp. BIUV-7]MDO6416892.1 GGDEF domain-containing protein [Sphingomonas sp. BIUV-7]